MKKQFWKVLAPKYQAQGHVAHFLSFWKSSEAFFIQKAPLFHPYTKYRSPKMHFFDNFVHKIKNITF